MSDKDKENLSLFNWASGFTIVAVILLLVLIYCYRQELGLTRGVLMRGGGGGGGGAPAVSPTPSPGGGGGGGGGGGLLGLGGRFGL